MALAYFRCLFWRHLFTCELRLSYDSFDPPFCNSACCLFSVLSLVEVVHLCVPLLHSRRIGARASVFALPRFCGILWRSCLFYCIPGHHRRRRGTEDAFPSFRHMCNKCFVNACSQSFMPAVGLHSCTEKPKPLCAGGYNAHLLRLPKALGEELQQHASRKWYPIVPLTRLRVLFGFWVDQGMQ